MTGERLPPGLIAGQYRVPADCRDKMLVGGLAAWPVADERAPGRKLMAIKTRPKAPPRARLLAARSDLAIPNTVMPVASGPGRDQGGEQGWFIVCDALPGQALSAETQRWREQELIAWVLKPAALALDGLHAAGMTHRAIRPDNLFRAGGRGPATLGPFWAAPPASLQPAVCEPPYSAWCMPAGRGDGTIADDVYALGVTLLALALGQLPLLGSDEPVILRRKLEVGSFAALTGTMALSPLLADLLRVMLAEDPDHRPSPALLLNPEQARARRVAARPARRAQKSFPLGGVPVQSARELAFALSLDPERGCQLLGDGSIDRWLRRSLGDPQLAVTLDEALSERDAADGKAGAQPATIMRAIVALDALAPLVWRRAVIQPDGLGGALAAGEEALASSLEEIVAQNVTSAFLAVSTHGERPPRPKSESREFADWLARRGPACGILRVTYQAEPMLACLSPLLTHGAAARLPELLDALEAASAHADRKKPPIDAHVAAFTASRADPSIASELTALAAFDGRAERLTVLRLFAKLQTRLHRVPLPGLAAWLSESGFAGLDGWRRRQTRAELAARLDEAVKAGQIGEMVAAIDDRDKFEADRAAAAEAADRAAALRDAVDRIERGTAQRAEMARRLGHEITTGLGLIAAFGAALRLAIG